MEGSNSWISRFLLEEPTHQLARFQQMPQKGGDGVHARDGGLNPFIEGREWAEEETDDAEDRLAGMDGRITPLEVL